VDEELLGGGLANAGLVSRRGDVVHRPSPPNAAAIHEFLRALPLHGFGGVPTPLRIGPDGREELGFVPGDVAVPPFPEWSTTDAVLAEVGALTRRFHDASQQLPVDTSVAWPRDLSDPEGGPMLVHNDICPENVVFRDGAAVALVDFDMVAPGRAIWDVATAARYWVPMIDPESAVVTGRQHLDPPVRLRILADAYGMSDADRNELVAVVELATQVARVFVADRVARRDPNFVAALDHHGGWARWDRIEAWLAANRQRFTDALAA
jgi:Phosphotransferase enzyme family